MADKIKGSDLFEDGLFDKGTKGATIFLKAIQDLKGGIAELMIISKNKIGVNNVSDFKGMQDLNKEISNANTLTAQKIKLDIEEVKALQHLEVLKQKELKTLADKEKVAREELKTEAAIRKEYENEAKAQEKANKQREKAEAISKKLSSTFEQNRKKLKELTSQLLDLKPGTAEFNKLAFEAGKIKDELSDAKDAVKAFSNESKSATAKTLFGQVGRDLADLDFKGAADKARILTQVVSQISFKEVIGGIKNFGSALLNLGSAVFLNPITAIAVGIGVLVGVTLRYKEQLFGLTDAQKENMKASDGVLIADEKLRASYEESLKVLRDLNIEYQLVSGQITEYEANIKRLENENREAIDNINKDTKKNTEEIVGFWGAVRRSLAQAVGLGSLEVQKQIEDLSKITTGANALIGKQEEILTEKKRIESQKRVNAIVAEIEEIIKKNDEAAKSEKAKRDKAAKEEADRREKERLAGFTKLNTDFTTNQNNFFLNNEKIREENEQRAIDAQIAANDEKKRVNDAFIDYELKAIEGKYGEEERIKSQQELATKIALGTASPAEQEFWYAQLQKKKDDALKAEEDAAKKQAEELKRIQESVFNALEKGLQKSSQKRQEFLDKEIDQRNENIDRQRDLAAKGLANTLAFEEAQKAKLELVREQEKKKEEKRQKAIAFLRLLSSYAEKDASTALPKAIADIALASLFENSFATGIEKLDGDGTETSDSILARLSKNESVITAKGTKENVGLPTAMNEGKVDEYFMNKYLPKVAMDSGLNTSTASNMASSLMLNQLIGVNARLKSLEHAIVNKREVHTNIDNVGNVITADIQNGFKKVVTKLRQKPRI